MLREHVLVFLLALVGGIATENLNKRNIIEEIAKSSEDDFSDNIYTVYHQVRGLCLNLEKNAKLYYFDSKLSSLVKVI